MQPVDDYRQQQIHMSSYRIRALATSRLRRSASWDQTNKNP